MKQPWRIWVNVSHESKSTHDIDGLVHERRNSSALAMELCLSCTDPLIWLQLNLMHALLDELYIQKYDFNCYDQNMGNDAAGYP